MVAPIADCAEARQPMAVAHKEDSPRITIVLALVTLAIGIYSMVYGLQTTFYFQAHSWASRNPFLRETLQQLPSTAASPVQTKNLSFYNLNFAAPWKGIASQKSGGAQSIMSFTSGPIIIFFDPQTEADPLETIRDGDPNLYSRYQQVFGHDLFPSTYDLYEAVYGASPSLLSPVMPRGKMDRIAALLEWKLNFGSDGASAIYSVSAAGMRGIQLGDPSRDHMVNVRLFDSRNHQYRLLFTSTKGPGTFPQADINCVLDSITPEQRRE